MFSFQETFRLKPVIIVACLFIVLISVFPFFLSLEQFSYDFRFKLKPPVAVSSDIVIIEISDDTLANLGKWPLPRDFHASLVDVLREAGVKAVIFDVLFSEPTLYDDSFATAMQRSKNVYLSAAFYLENKAFAKKSVADSSMVLSQPLELFNQNAKAIGHINVQIDNDGKVRSIPLFVRYGGKIYPEIALRVACDKLGLNPLNFKQTGGGVLIDNKLYLPLTPEGNFLVNYPGSWEKSFRHFSYFEILKSYSDSQKGKRPTLDLAGLKNKICFIGLTATGTSDLQSVPVENIYPLVGLQASVLSSILQKKFITEEGVLPNLVINLLLFAVSLAVCLSFAPLRAFLGVIILGTCYFIVSLILFNSGIWIGLFNPLLVVTLTYVSVTLYRFLSETKRRQLLEKELEIARDIQKSFLPGEIRVPKNLSIHVHFCPARFVAGDLYDITNINDEEIGVFIADVSGKGVPAALIMAQTISLFRLLSRQNNDCAITLSRLNAELYARLSGRFITGTYVLVNSSTGKSSISSAGHLPVILYQRKTASVSELDASSGGLPLGVSEDSAYERQDFHMQPGDLLIFYTDGVIEARSKNNEEFGMERFKKIVASNGGLAADELFEKIKEELHKFSFGAEQHDDISLIILEMRAIEKGIK